MTVIGVVAPGAMGSAVSRRLIDHGATVLTLLGGRSAATRARAAAAGMTETDEAGLMAADAILSIVPPSDARALAERLAPVLQMARRVPIYADCNALDVQTVLSIGEIITKAGGRFVDGGIIGLPPTPGTAGPKFYLAGPEARALAGLMTPLGLLVEPMNAPVGAASALKMSYAGITKGLAALASIMILGAERGGAGPDLRAELAASQPQLLARFTTSLPDMLPKAYRWVAEMREIAAFLGEDAAGAQVYEGIAQFYARIAADTAGERSESRAIEAFTAGPRPES